jgi:hypothetical protein
MSAAARRRGVLVTGSHRSGTTWAGGVLAACPRTRLIHEPFNLDLVRPDRPFDPGLWFRMIDEDSPAGLRRAAARTPGGVGYFVDLHRLRPLSARGARLRARAAAALLRRRLRGDAVIWKDPIAFFSAEWMDRRLGLRPLVMIRHPAAFVSSLKLKGWRFDFGNFTKQPRLMETHLAPWAEAIDRAAAEPPDIVEQGILLWNAIYGTAAAWREAHPDWLFARHEDLSLDPVGGFRDLAGRLGLDFGPEQAAHVEAVSGAGNPVEQTADEFRRDAAANIDNWRRRLSPEEIDRVMRGTEAVRPRFYADA